MGGGVTEGDRRLATIRQLVGVLEDKLRHQRFEAGRSAANQLVSTTTDWIAEIQRDPTADAELSAALHVFRNAGFAFRRWCKAGTGSNESLQSTCSTLIGQGKDLLQLHLNERPPGES
jgi:hypothetical protein